MNFTIARKLYVLIAAVVLGLAIFSVYNIKKMKKVHEDASFGTVNTVPSLLVITEINNAISSTRINTWKYLALSDAQESVSLGRLELAQKRVSEAMGKYEKYYIADSTDRDDLNAVREFYLAFLKRQAEVMALAKGDKWDDARALMKDSQPIIDKMSKALEEHRNYKEKLSKEAAEKSVGTIRDATLQALIISISIISLVTTLGLLVSRKIVRSIAQAVEVAEAIATGDLTRDIPVTSKDEIGLLMQAMSRMNDGLIDIVSNVRSGVSTIAAASSQIAMGNKDLSARTEVQAGTLEETASATEELTATVNQNADNASHANRLASSASHVALKGGEVVGQVAAKMHEINASSAKIVDIIAVIDGIAFQTNILSLNAAVEAARAGETGRGFAVVASEVRNLALRSASAAKEIKQLIDDSVAKVDSGCELVDQAAGTLAQIVNSVQSVTDVVSEISSASNEQSIGIEQVNQAIGQMDQTTQENAALVEEASAAAQALQEQALQLERTVSLFKVATARATTQGPVPVIAMQGAW